MEHRATVCELYAHLAANTPGLMALTAENLGAELIGSYDSELAAVCAQRAKLRLKNTALPEKSKSAYQLFYAARKQYHEHGLSSSAGAAAAAEVADEDEDEGEGAANDPRYSGNKLHEHILGEWSNFKATKSGGTGHYGELAMEQKWKLRRAHENWLRAYHTQEPPPPPWTPEAKSELTASSSGRGRGRGAGAATGLAAAGGGRGRGRGRGSSGGGGGSGGGKQPLAGAATAPLA